MPPRHQKGIANRAVAMHRPWPPQTTLARRGPPPCRAWHHRRQDFPYCVDHFGGSPCTQHPKTSNVQSHSSCHHGFSKLRSTPLWHLQANLPATLCAPTQTQGGSVEESHIAHLPKHLEPSQADRDGNQPGPRTL